MAFFDELDLGNRFSAIAHRLNSYRLAVDKLLTEYDQKRSALADLRDEVKQMREASLFEEYSTRLDKMRRDTASDIQSRIDLIDDSISAWMLKPAPAGLLTNLQALAAAGVQLSDVEFRTFRTACAGSYVCSRILDHMATASGLSLTNKPQPSAEQLAKSVRDAGSFAMTFIRTYAGEQPHWDFVAEPEPLRYMAASISQRLRGDNAIVRAALVWNGDDPQRLNYVPSEEAREAIFAGTTHLERQKKLASILDESPWLFESFASDPGTRADALAWKQAQQKQAGTATA